MMIIKLLSNGHMISKIIIKLLKNTILEKNERKVLLVFNGMIDDMINNKILNLVITELFIRGRKLNTSFVFITQYLQKTRDVRLNYTHFFIMKIPNKRKLQQIALNHSSDIDFQDFIKMYKKCTAESFSFLVNNTIFPSVNPLRLRGKNLK